MISNDIMRNILMNFCIKTEFHFIIPNVLRENLTLYFSIESLIHLKRNLVKHERDHKVKFISEMIFNQPKWFFIWLSLIKDIQTLSFRI